MNANQRNISLVSSLYDAGPSCSRKRNMRCLEYIQTRGRYVHVKEKVRFRDLPGKKKVGLRQSRSEKGEFVPHSRLSHQEDKQEQKRGETWWWTENEIWGTGGMFLCVIRLWVATVSDRGHPNHSLMITLSFPKVTSWSLCLCMHLYSKPHQLVMRS